MQAEASLRERARRFRERLRLRKSHERLAEDSESDSEDYYTALTSEEPEEPRRQLTEKEEYTTIYNWRTGEFVPSKSLRRAHPKRYAPPTPEMREKYPAYFSEAVIRAALEEMDGDVVGAARLLSYV